jgi:hypothetical protein
VSEGVAHGRGDRQHREANGEEGHGDGVAMATTTNSAELRRVYPLFTLFNKLPRSVNPRSFPRA